MFKNTAHSYGWVSIAMHWITAVLVIGLFILGYWMLTLGYYDSWYRLGPWWHKSFGITLLVLTVIRLLWSLSNQKPEPLGTPWEKRGATVGHALIYGLLFVTLIRSEEHTSELQSRPHLVCRLLLEKKKKIK